MPIKHLTKFGIDGYMVFISFSSGILPASEGILRFAIHGKSYAKFKTVQTLYPSIHIYP